jgi:lactoylglutathione lyase
MLGLWSTLTSPMGMKLHYAFQVTVEDAIASIEALKDAGLQPTGLTGQAINEPEVIPWIPAASVYFPDPDGHSLEYIAMLPEAPAPAKNQMPLSEWRCLQSAPGM